MSDMGRRHFKSLAGNLSECRPDPLDTDAYHAWRSAVSAVIWTCKRFNAQFDSARFLEACGTLGIDATEPTRDQKIAKAMALIAEAGPDQLPLPLFDAAA